MFDWCLTSLIELFLCKKGDDAMTHMNKLVEMLKKFDDRPILVYGDP